MSDLEKLHLLTGQMHLEPTENRRLGPLPPGGHSAIFVKNAQLPDGNTIPLLKTLLSSYCENNCVYCPFRSQRDIRRTAFSPDDFAKLFINLYKSGFVDGIFLSSSIWKGPVQSQDKLLATAWLLRHKYHYQGYLHLKIMPGAENEQIKQAMYLADRLSINLEAPHSQALRFLAPRKDLQEDLIKPLLWMEKIRQQLSPTKTWNGRWPSSTTQYVVGAAGESDRQLLETTHLLHNQAGISRAYFSNFNPIRDTPLESHPPSPPIREFRLYQASYLIKDYGYEPSELIFENDDNLPHQKDPKLTWAEKNLIDAPIEITKAPRSRLVRIPGIGLQKAEQILSLQGQAGHNSIDRLLKLRLIPPQSHPFILVNGKKPTQQLSFL
jgi:predicted DNA-binding helix-hairpin-helix protein